MKRLIALAVAMILASVSLAYAQDYPSRSITLIVPFAAGGPTDTVARLIADAMGRDLGQQILVENVTGAGGTVAAAQAAAAAPDGYTLFIHHIGLATAATLYRTLPYDTATAFAPIGQVTTVPMTIIARADFPPAANDLPGLIEYVRANVDTVTMANAGIGAASHLCGLLFQSLAEVQLVTVPYQGTGPAMTDLLGGNVDFMCDQTTNTIGQIQSGAVKAYAVTSPERLAAAPDLPTAAEGGLPDMTFGVWHGVYAPAGTPAEIIDRLAAALQVALADPTVIERFTALATAPVPLDLATPQALADHLAAEILLWQPIIEAAGVYAD
ncbi:MAG: tripartite tricarboxylate transporter substrate-binding protein [Bauldia sp.]